VQHHTLMGALSRVLAEDYRKSADLTYNIVRVFLAFSNFLEMHAILAQYRNRVDSTAFPRRASSGGREESPRPPLSTFGPRHGLQVPRGLRVRADPGL